MPVSTLDPTAALIVIDLQAGLAGAPTIHPFEGVVANAAALADAFRSRSLPVVLVNADGRPQGRTERSPGGKMPAGFAELLPELNKQPSDTTITKQTWGAFHDNDLAERLAEDGVTQVVITGVATSLGVESTARQAHEHGFHVALAIDAMTDVDSGGHDRAVETIFPMLGETATTAQLLALLAERGPAAGSPKPEVGTR